jgi:putative ABC transport system permease protein
MESVVLTFFAGLLGLLVGVWALEAISPMFNGESESFIRNPEVDVYVVLIAILVIVITGAFAGFLPAQRAIKIKAIDALRDE